VALAGLKLGEQRQPVGRCEVNRLRNVEAKVESLVVGRGKSDDKLSLALDVPSESTL
jgi:hypothetical protein